MEHCWFSPGYIKRVNKNVFNLKFGNRPIQTIVEKIFHSFFTAKLAARATGLGLSLAYAIVKSHAVVPIAIGIKVLTRKYEGSIFIIQLANP